MEFGDTDYLATFRQTLNAGKMNLSMPAASTALLASNVAKSNALVAASRAAALTPARSPVMTPITQQTSGGGGVSVFSAQPQAVAGNRVAAQDAGTTAIGLAQTAAAGLNPTAATEFYKALDTALPGYRSMVGQMQTNTMSALKGELPPDVVNMITMIGGEKQNRGALAGTPRDLGLTSLQRSDQGFVMGGQMLGLAKNFLTAPTYDVFQGYTNAFNQLFQSSAVTPAQAASVALQSRQLDLSGAQLMENARQFDAGAAWTRELSAMNQAFEREKMSIESGLSNQVMANAAAGNAIETSAFQNMMARTVGPGAAPITPPKAEGQATTLVKPGTPQVVELQTNLPPIEQPSTQVGTSPYSARASGPGPGPLEPLMDALFGGNPYNRSGNLY